LIANLGDAISSRVHLINSRGTASCAALALDARVTGKAKERLSGAGRPSEIERLTRVLVDEGCWVDFLPIKLTRVDLSVQQVIGMKPPPFPGGCHRRSALLGIEGEEEFDGLGRLGWLDRVPPIGLLEIGLYTVGGEDIDGQIPVAVHPPQRHSSIH
jgi:hypothetical protein